MLVASRPSSSTTRSAASTIACRVSGVRDPAMTIATLSWPAAVVAATAVASVGLILTVATWQIFRTGQTAIKSERGRPDA
jgi:hypothetical protein